MMDFLRKNKKITFVFLSLCVIFAVLLYRNFDVLNFKDLIFYQEKIISFSKNDYYICWILLFVISMLLTSIAIPGDVVISLISGSLFGFWSGILLVSFSNAIGSTILFIISRFLLRDFFTRKFHNQMNYIDNKFNEKGDIYLLSLRLLPIFPDFLISIIMGLTKIKTMKFYFITQLGTLIGISLFVNAGLQISKITSVNDIYSPSLFLSLIIIGLIPLLFSYFKSYFQ